jgi:hypothetical protein
MTNKTKRFNFWIDDERLEKIESLIYDHYGRTAAEVIRRAINDAYAARLLAKPLAYYEQLPGEDTPTQDDEDKHIEGEKYRSWSILNDLK